MNILLVVATGREIAPLLKGAKPASKKQPFSTYRSGKNTIDVLITGVGMTATAFYLGKYLNKKYDLAINAGIAGSFKKSIPVGSVVNVVSDRFADMGAEDGNKFLTAEVIGLVKKEEYIVSGSRYRKSLGLKRVNGVTVNTVHGNAQSIRTLIKKFNPDIESMEGAAFFLSCGLEKIPCIQIRAISNYIEKRNKKNWKMDLAINNLSLTLLKIFSQFN